MKRIYTHIVTSGDLQPQSLEDAIASLPDWRRRKALAFRFAIDRFTCAEAYLLLKQGLRELYGIEGDVEFAYGPAGKPSLAGFPGIHFSLSHCRTAVACVISDREVGIDVEEIQYDEGLAAAVLNSAELEQVRLSDDPALAFTSLWTRKESLLKLDGEGLRNDLRHVLDCSGDAIFETVGMPEGAAVLVSVCSR